MSDRESSDAGPTPAILVVDDDESVRSLTALALRRAGYSVVEAGDGPSALEALAAAAIAMVVLDVQMPGMSGTDLVKALRRQPDTATLPILLMTGSGDDHSVIEGLAAGADDFLAKPVRLDELVARVAAHVRTSAIWTGLVAQELKARRDVVAALAAIRPSSDPEEAAEQVVAELARRTDADFLGVLQLDDDGRLVELATFSTQQGVRRGGATLPSDTARMLVEQAQRGPWLDHIDALPPTRTAPFENADLEVAAGAPIYSDDRLVGLLSIGLKRGTDQTKRARESQLLAAAIDYASVLSAVAGHAIDDRRRTRATAVELKRSLAAREFEPVFQRIVDLETMTTVGYEALTRFTDGTPPDVRFDEAARAGLATEYELAAIRAALAASADLPVGAFLSLNVSPAVLIKDGRHLGQLIQGVSRPLVIELTEHLAISDYPELRSAISRLGDVSIAVDDAGAGFASLRHIVELEPAFVKLDISLIRNVDTDTTRQALVAGLQYFAVRTEFRLIAEGVETEAQLDTLRLIGVDLAQGYLLGRPQPAG